MKRFYKEVGTREDEDGKWRVEVDGRVVKTPMKTPIAVPSEALGMVIAQEWDAQVDVIAPHTMPATTLAATVLDRYPGVRDKVVTALVGYLNADSLCFRNHNPESLALRQKDAWDPVVADLKTHLGIVLDVTDGLIPRHPQETPGAVRAYLEALSDWELAALEKVAGTTRSVSLALAMHANLISAHETLVLSRLEEAFQTGVWGVVEGGHDLDEAVARLDVATADVAWSLVRAGDL